MMERRGRRRRNYIIARIGKNRIMKRLIKSHGTITESWAAQQLRYCDFYEAEEERNSRIFPLSHFLCSRFNIWSMQISCVRTYYHIIHAWSHFNAQKGSLNLFSLLPHPNEAHRWDLKKLHPKKKKINKKKFRWNIHVMRRIYIFDDDVTDTPVAACMSNSN